MSPEEKEKIVDNGINAINDTDASDYNLSDYQRKIVKDFTKDDPIVAIGRKNGKFLMWLQYMYIMIYGTTPTYDKLLEFAKDVSTVGRKVETESKFLIFSIGSPKERTIADVKKDIKHEKNPMRLKQLNKELNKLYKENKRKKKEEG